MTQVVLIHAFKVVSRSGKAVASLGEEDLDDDHSGDPGERIARLASIAHCPKSDAVRHGALSAALSEALDLVERMPGQPAAHAVTMADGRGALVERRIGLSTDLA